MDYKHKYIKYKNKYIKHKIYRQFGGGLCVNNCGIFAPVGENYCCEQCRLGHHTHSDDCNYFIKNLGCGSQSCSFKPRFMCVDENLDDYNMNKHKQISLVSYTTDDDQKLLRIYNTINTQILDNNYFITLIRKCNAYNGYNVRPSENFDGRQLPVNDILRHEIIPSVNHGIYKYGGYQLSRILYNTLNEFNDSQLYQEIRSFLLKNINFLLIHLIKGLNKLHNIGIIHCDSGIKNVVFDIENVIRNINTPEYIENPIKIITDNTKYIDFGNARFIRDQVRRIIGTRSERELMIRELMFTPERDIYMLLQSISSLDIERHMMDDIILITYNFGEIVEQYRADYLSIIPRISINNETDLININRTNIDNVRLIEQLNEIQQNLYIDNLYHNQPENRIHNNLLEITHNSPNNHFNQTLELSDNSSNTYFDNQNLESSDINTSEFNTSDEIQQYVR